MTTFDRPVKAELVVRLDNGEEWPATPEDLAQFGLVDKLTAYMRFDDKLREVLLAEGLIERDLTTAQLNQVRYMVEVAIMFPELLDEPEHEGWAEVVDLERRLQELSD